MSKLITMVLLFVLVLLSSAGLSYRESTLGIGDEVPSMQVSNSAGTFDTDKCDGEYVLLTFWSSADAQSRIDCNMYNAWFNDRMPRNIKHVGLNFDSQDELFREVVRLDSFDTKAHYNVQGIEAEQIRSGFGLSHGYGSVLISPDGRVDRFNPTISELSSLI